MEEQQKIEKQQEKDKLQELKRGKIIKGRRKTIKFSKKQQKKSKVVISKDERIVKDKISKKKGKREK